MDLVFLDSNFNTIKFVDYINLQWNRRYYECGQYSVQILARDFDKEFQYVYRASEREIGVDSKGCVYRRRTWGICTNKRLFHRKCVK